MVEKMNTIDKVREIIADIAHVKCEDLIDQVNLQEQYDLSSIDVIQMILKIEEAFGIEFSENELDPENVKNVLTITEVVNRLLELKSIN